MVILEPQDENYCMLIVDRGLKKREAYKIATGKNHKGNRAFDAAVCRFHNRPKIKARILELQKETNKIRRDSIRDTIQKIAYDKKDAFEDYRELHKIALEQKNTKSGISAIDSIVKLLGLSEETREEVVFKIMKEKENAKNNKPTP